MSSMNLLLALILAAAVPVSEIAKRVEALVARLAADDYETREQATRDLMRLGVDAEPLLREALASSQDPEVRERLDEALLNLVGSREEAFALACLQSGSPFPQPTKRPVRVEISQVMVAQAIEKIAGEFGLEIEFFKDDRWLQEEAGTAPILGSTATTAPDPQLLLEFALTNNLELTYVVDGKRIIIVRLTPAILLERLAREEPRASEFQEQSMVEDFFSRKVNHWGSIHWFIQRQTSEKRKSRVKWVEELVRAAKDRDATPESRCRAIRGFRWLYGAAAVPQHDATAHLLEILKEDGAPEAIRTEAVRVLPHCPEPEAVDELFRILEGPAPEPKSALLFQLGRTGGISALGTIRADEILEERLHKDLVALSGSPDAEVAARSATLRVLLMGDKDALESMNALALSSDQDTSWMVIEALRVSAFKDFAQVKGRIDALARDKDAKLRAAAACLYGRTSGGKARGHDVAESRRLLADPAPVVRACAAHALGVIYSLQAAEAFREGLDSCLEHLQDLLKEDPDERVKTYVKAALDQMPVR